ncbi:MAG TPA: hypothetical protein DCM86_14780 [Verrucomicrobiales bacterium]|nr:hypothetical protein [Verrucomicrobiales bacterium]
MNAKALLSILALATGSLPVSAQWVTQTNQLKAGWNGVYLHVDATHANLASLVAPEIQEIWRWSPALNNGQFVDTPTAPSVALGSGWVSWSRNASQTSPLQVLVPNAAYLVRVSDTVGTSTISWLVQGRPAPPDYAWTLTGLNFVGFSTPAAAPPSFFSFFDPDAQPFSWRQDGQVYQYGGGELGPSNPERISPFLFPANSVRRDQAYWLRAGENYNHYFGPFEVRVESATGLRFGTAGSRAQIRLKNRSKTSVTVTLREVASEAAPAGSVNSLGQTVSGIPPLAPVLVRTGLNTTNLTYGYKSLLAGSVQWTLAPAGTPGSEVEVLLGLNRFAAQMQAAPGTVAAGILEFTDSLQLSQVQVGVSGEVASSAGLWVGAAAAENVDQYLTKYVSVDSRDGLDQALADRQLSQGQNGYRYDWDAASKRVLVFGGPDGRTGSYLQDGPVNTASGGVARPFPLRLIIHNDGATSRLLQRVYFGPGVSSDAVVALQESSLDPSKLSDARRISAVHLPWSEANTPWTFTGALQQGGTLSTQVALSYDDQNSNPFLHTYHPDHDNLDAQFEAPLDRGLESYDVLRSVTLRVAPPADDFVRLTSGFAEMTGVYTESITFKGQGTQARQFNLIGSFTLKRLTDIATLK